MDLTSVIVTKNEVVLIEGAKGKTANGLVNVEAAHPAGLEETDEVTITAAGAFEVTAFYIDEEPAGWLNFKID